MGDAAAAARRRVQVSVMSCGSWSIGGETITGSAPDLSLTETVSAGQADTAGTTAAENLGTSQGVVSALGGQARIRSSSWARRSCRRSPALLFTI